MRAIWGWQGSLVETPQLATCSEVFEGPAKGIVWRLLAALHKRELVTAAHAWVEREAEEV